jgi:hypothetical protein
MRNDASPKGIVTTRMQARSPASRYPRKRDQPAVSSQMMFRTRVRTLL